MNNFRSSKIYLVKLLLMLYLVFFFGFYTNAFAVSDTQTNTEINTQELNTPYSFRQLTSPTFDKYKEFIDQIGNKVKEFINLSDSKPKVSTVVATQPKVLKINKKVEAKNKIETKDKVEANTKLLPTQILTPTKVVERIIERPTTIFINQTDPSIIVRLQNLERSNSNNASFNSLQVDRIYDSVNKNISNNSNDITESGTLNSPTFTGTTTITGNTINLSGTNPLIDGTNASGTLSINTTTNRPVPFGSGVVTIPILNASVVGTITKANNLTGGNSTTLLGSLPYQSDTDTSTLLAPNTTTTKNFLSMTGTGTNGAVPAWSTVTATDVGLGNVTNESKATMFTSPTFTGTVAGFTMGGNIALGANTFTTSNTGLVTNLNADLLDGQHGSYYATASSLGSYVPYTGANANLNLGTYNITTSAINNLPLSQDNTDFNVKVGQDAGLNIVTGAQYNTFLGYQAGTSGSGTSTNAADANTAVGYHSLYSNTTGYRNTANGYNSLYSNTTGYYNTANGGKSLYSNTTGSSNTAIGDCALCTNTTGSNNTAIGDGAGYSGTGVFIQNTLIGAETGYNGSTPYSYNTAVGYRAGYNLFGNSNVMFGMFAGAYELGSNSFYVDNQDRANTAGDKAGALLYGMFNSTPSLQTLTINASTTIAQNLNVLGAGNNYFVGNLGIGTSSPTAALHLKAGTATAGTAPLKFTSGTLLTTPEAGAVEFLTDAYYGTITTGGARKTFAFLESPVFTTNITTPLILGGSATTSDLTLQTTSGVGATGADMHFLVGNNGATEAMTILNSGNVGIGTTNPASLLTVNGNALIGATSVAYAADYKLQVVGTSHGLLAATNLPSSSTNGLALSVGVTGEPYVRTNFYSNGQIGFGPGSATRDVFIGRTSSNTIGITGAYDGTGTGNFYVSGNVGIGTTAPTGKLDVQGLAVNDLPTYSAEFLSGSGWTSTDWTGDFATGWTHTVGNTSVLSQSTAAVNATKYQIAYTVTGRTAGSFTIGFGGQSVAGITATSSWGPTTTSTASLTITPTTDFDGTIVISIKSITAVSTPLVNLKSSDGTARIEMRANTATGNTFIGVGAGRYNTTGLNNTTNGNSSLYSNTTGSNNTANGYASLYYNTTGNNNTADGLYSLQANTTGVNNTASGYSSLFANTTASQNTAFGNISLYSNTTGSYNTGLGYASGRFIADGTTANTTSDQGVYIGANTRAGADNNQNEIVIGYNAIGAGSNTIRLGNTSVLRTYAAGLNLSAGTATAGNAPLKLTSGTDLTTPEAGAFEYDGTNLHFTPVATRETIAYVSNLTTGYVPYTGANANVNLGTYSLTTPNILGGTSTTQDLTLQTTSGVGATGADMHFLVGNNGATEAMTILNSGNVGIGTTNPASLLTVNGNALIGATSVAYAADYKLQVVGT